MTHGLGSGRKNGGRTPECGSANQTAGGYNKKQKKRKTCKKEGRGALPPPHVTKTIKKHPYTLYKGVLKIYSVFQRLLNVLICSKNILSFSEIAKCAYIFYLIVLISINAPNFIRYIDQSKQGHRWKRKLL